MRFAAVELVLLDLGAADHVERGRGLVVILAVPAAVEIERLPVVAFGDVPPPPLLLGRAQVHEVARDGRVTRPVHRPVDREHHAVERIRQGVVTGVEVRVREFGERDPLFLGRPVREGVAPRGVFEQRDRLVVVALLRQDDPERARRIGQLAGRAVLLEHREPRAHERVGLVEAGKWPRRSPSWMSVDA